MTAPVAQKITQPVMNNFFSNNKFLGKILGTYVIGTSLFSFGRAWNNLEDSQKNAYTNQMLRLTWNKDESAFPCFLDKCLKAAIIAPFVTPFVLYNRVTMIRKGEALNENDCGCKHCPVDNKEN